jgi:hypothetical protein
MAYEFSQRRIGTDDELERSSVMHGRAIAVRATIVFGAGILWAQSPQTIHGFVSEAHCGAAHSSPSVAATICMQKCMKAGSPAVIVSDGKVYQLKGDTAAVAEYIGQYVTVQGMVDGSSIKVVSVRNRIVVSPARSIANAR